MIAGSGTAPIDASQAATDWLIRLQDDPDNPALRRRFEAWLAASPAHAAAWATTQRTSHMLSTVPPSHDDRWAPFVAAMRATPPTRRPRPPPKAWQAGIALAAAACLAFLAGPTAMLHLRADYITGTGQTRTITLADGSSVALAPESAISVTYGMGERRVDLLAGEAFFTVNHNPDRPFRVTVGGVEAIDIGTAFDIRRTAAGATIAVRQGSVRVDDAATTGQVSETLTAGQSLRITPGSAQRETAPPTQVAAWRQGQIIAQDQPMREIVDQIRPYYRGTILLTNQHLAGRPVTGVYNLADPIDALRGVAQAHGATVHQITPWLLLVSGN
ncbi:MAG: FecR domain-containing protein [Azospirillaceae bacterium]|nr:FecR domain-containing protein [Azospirillaceae bacterium]